MADLRLKQFLRPPLCLCVSVVNTSVPRTTKRRLLREAALVASRHVRIHHRGTETLRGTEELFMEDHDGGADVV